MAVALPSPVGRQSDVIYLAPTGHTVVLGTAGTGKTLMAILRAAYLAQATTPGHGPTLLVTYNNMLVTYLKHLKPDLATEVTVETYGRFARGYLNARGKMPSFGGIADKNPLFNLVQQAVSTVAAGVSSKFLGRDTRFFLDELAWIAGMGIHTLDQYLVVDRVGRSVGLPKDLRALMWQVRDAYLVARIARGYLYDWNDIATAVRVELAADPTPRRYRHVVIDEGQDLSPEAIRSLVEAVPPGGSVSFFGDFVQQIYGQGISWRSSGLVVPHGVKRFRDNYRNSAEVARVAIAMTAMENLKLDEDDLVEPVAPTAAGPQPVVVACADNKVQLDLVRQLAQQLSRSKSVAVLARTWPLVNTAVAGLTTLSLESNRWVDGPGIYAGTYHSAKGLEFGAVILPYCDADNLPLDYVVDAFGEDEAAARDARLLYVAVTRPQAELIITHTGTRTALLPTAPGLFLEQTR